MFLFLLFWAINNALVMFMVSSIGILTYKSLMSKVISWYLSFIVMFFRSCARFVEFFTLYWYCSCIYDFSVFEMNLASLYVGAFILLTTGLIGVPILCNFIWAFSVGAWGFLCMRCFVWFLFMMSWHCLRFSMIFFWKLFVGSLLSFRIELLLITLVFFCCIQYYLCSLLFFPCLLLLSLHYPV
jgi:hypothetical protein